MPLVSFSDNTQKQFDSAVTLREIVSTVYPELSNTVLAGKINDQLVDLSKQITQDSKISFITAQDPEGLEIIRHSTAHLLAQAVKALYPAAQITIGPVIENGFYYDIYYPDGFTLADLEPIENKMRELVKQKLPVKRETLSRNEAIKLFESLGEHYKAKIIADIPETETLSVYWQGDFVDLCRGPHVPNTRQLGAFKLTKLAGAYWRGDSNNEMLQRIYGTAWSDQAALDHYLKQIEEAEKRDHRKLGKKMDLFHFQEEAPGMPFWHPNGWIVYQQIEQYLRARYQEYGYQEVRTPQLLDRSLWERSGHWDKFGDDMFITESETHTYAIKPMNCPCHVQIFKQGVVSYRDLPLRLAEFGSCHRNEASGTLHGLLRARSFVQDDGHIFCTHEQIQPEVSAFIDQLFRVYKDFGFKDIIFRVATRPEKRVGSDEVWDQAEQALQTALRSKGLSFDLAPGDGAFYGPKIEFHLRDCLGRTWQCGTMQVDFSMPERLGAHYIDEHSNKVTPVMLHRALIGTLERFIGILLEETAGALPFWLAPIQVMVLSISDKQGGYAYKIVESLKNLGVRARSDLRNEKIGFKIRQHAIHRIPYLLIVGEKEVEADAVSVRDRNAQDLGSMTLMDFIAYLAKSSEWVDPHPALARHLPPQAGEGN